jgi:hypothetical protein
MTEQDYLDFTTALGEVYSTVIDPHCEHGAVIQDGYEVFGKAYGYDDITPEKLHAAQVSSAELLRLRDLARQNQESDLITEEHIREILRGVLWRWPPEAR